MDYFLDVPLHLGIDLFLRVNMNQELILPKMITTHFL